MHLNDRGQCPLFLQLNSPRCTALVVAAVAGGLTVGNILCLLQRQMTFAHTFFGEGVSKRPELGISSVWPWFSPFMNLQPAHHMKLSPCLSAPPYNKKNRDHGDSSLSSQRQGNLPFSFTTVSPGPGMLCATRVLMC